VRAISLKVRGKEDGASLAGEKAHQVADPDDPLRVKSVDGFVEDQGVRVAEQRGGDAKALAHAEGEATDPLLGDGLEPGHLDDLLHARLADAVCRTHREQVVVGAATGVHGLRVQQRADLLHGGAVLVVATAVDGHRASSGVVQTDDQPHCRGLPGAVRAEEAGDFSGVHGERDVVYGRLLSVAHAQAVILDHRWGPWCLSRNFHPEARGSHRSAG